MVYNTDVTLSLEIALSMIVADAWEDRARGAAALGRTTDARSLEALSRALTDSNTAVVEAAAIALLERFDDGARSALISGFRDADSHSVEHLADVLRDAEARGAFAADLLAGRYF